MTARPTRADLRAEVDHLRAALAQANIDLTRARSEAEHWRETADVYVEIAIENADRCKAMAVESDNLAASLSAAVESRFELDLAGRVLPDLNDAVDLMAPTWPIVSAPIYEALRGEAA